jgi:hypothetical protein
MQCVTDPIRIKNGSTRSAAFNQRYPNKGVNFGDVILKDRPVIPSTCAAGPAQALMECMAIFDKHVTDTRFPDKQIAFNLMLTKALTRLRESSPKSGYTIIGDPIDPTELQWWTWFTQTFINTDTYNISPTALSVKARSRKEYMPANIGETGWMVVELDGRLDVPDEDGEYFIGWGMLNQPPDLLQPQYTEGSVFAQSQGWALHQGPGMLFMTGGDHPHIGTQEPYLLEHNYPPTITDHDPASRKNQKRREKQQLPTVHWRLDEPSVIRAGLKKGAITETNVGAAQLMLQSVGSLTQISQRSRSPNFLAYLAALGLKGSVLADFLQTRTIPAKNISEDAKVRLEQYNTANPIQDDGVYEYLGPSSDLNNLSTGQSSSAPYRW